MMQHVPVLLKNTRLPTRIKVVQAPAVISLNPRKADDLSLRCKNYAM